MDNENEFKMRKSELELLNDRVNEDISNLGTIWNSIIGAIFALIITTFVVNFNKNIEVFSYFIALVVIGFLVLIIVHIYFLKKELNEILTWFTIIWFKSDINISQALKLYLDLKNGLKNYKYLMKGSKSGKIISGILDGRISKNRFWYLTTGGLVIPTLIFAVALNLSPENLEFLMTTFILLTGAYLSNLGVLWKMSSLKIKLVRSTFALLFTDQSFDLHAYWEDKLRDGLKKFDENREKRNSK